jgi:hypothetical protein
VISQEPIIGAGGAGVVTVTTQKAVLFPSVVVTVIVAVPAAIGVITPLLLTAATPLLLVDQLTELSVALDGKTVAVSLPVKSPTMRCNVVESSITPVTATLDAVSSGETGSQPEFTRNITKPAVNKTAYFFIKILTIKGV